MAEENKDKLHIRLHVYDTELPVNIVREDEKLYRDAAKLITTTVNNYAGVFKGRKSDKELLYMALIDIAYAMSARHCVMIRSLLRIFSDS